MKVSVFGTGYVGLVTGACLANLGHEVLCIDIDENKIRLLNDGQISFYEPGLKNLVLKNKEKKRLYFSTSIQNGVAFGDVIFNCVGTPGKADGSADLSFVFSVTESVAKFSDGYKVLVNKSTVPPGTAKKCHELIKKTNPHSEVEMVSNPEFLAEGKAVHDFTHPDKIVVGALTTKAFDWLRKIYTGRVRTYIPFLETDWETAEIIKYANNSFLATKVSFINEIANICDKIGADVKIVSQAMGMDYRISPKFLNAGVGYGGSCFPKDVRALSHLAAERGYDAKLLKEVDTLNKRQRESILNRLKERFGTGEDKSFTVWGIAFKPKTSDIREAPALDVIHGLLSWGAKVNVCDPIAMREVKSIFGDKIKYCENLQESVKDSSAIILMTEWDEFRNVDFTELGLDMINKVVFDGRNIYEPELVQEEGFEYFGVGRR
jgi:UDPglucose 6-dehydrogenase